MRRARRCDRLSGREGTKRIPVISSPVLPISIPFDIDRPLTEEERRETEFYCDHDVDTNDQFIIKAICNGASIEEVKELNDDEKGLPIGARIVKKGLSGLLKGLF